MTKQPRTLLLFYVLVAYVALQFVWWSYLLTSLSSEVMQQKKEVIENTQRDVAEKNQLLDAINEKHHSRLAMIVGEGSVFLGLLIFGIYRVKRSFEKETELAVQQKNFMLSITHELKTPLAAIKLNLQTLLRRKTDEATQQLILKRSAEETDRLNQLIENVLMAARMENASIRFHRQKINLTEFLKKFTSRYESTGRLILEAPENTEVMADEQLALPLLFSNLIENALKYSEQEICVRVRTEGMQVVTEIADKGKGIRNEEKTKIFDRFYRLGNEETRNHQGTGLGLFIVKSIAEKNEIKLSVHDNQPNGTIFQLTFLS
jgi:two-component system, OmpR family, phosphate regulon sensor histidine kinase PhoR